MLNLMAMALPINLPGTVDMDTMTLERDTAIAGCDDAAGSNLVHSMTGVHHYFTNLKDNICIRGTEKLNPSRFDCFCEYLSILHN